MGEVYFTGTDTYDCIHLGATATKDKVHTVPTISSCFDVAFTNFYSVYKKNEDVDSFSWFMTGLGLTETEIFASPLGVTQIAASKNAIVGLSEDGGLFRITLEADDNRELVCLKTSEVKAVEGDSAIILKKITSNENDIFGLEASPNNSIIYKIERSLERIAEFPGKNIVDFSVGFGHFVALSDSGGLWNWGHCGRSELASRDVNVMTVCKEPRRVEFFDDLPCIVVKVVCGGWHTLVLTSDGDIYSWGWNESGQLGHNNLATHTNKGDPYPVDLGSAEDPVVDIGAGARHSVAVLKSGRVFAWGRNQEGQSGLGCEESCSEPKEVAKVWNGTASTVKCFKWSTFIYTS